MPSPLKWDLEPTDRAKFATTARLLSCLVTETLTPAFYQSVKGEDELAGFVLVLTANFFEGQGALKPADVLAIVPLHHPPVFGLSGHGPFGKAVGLLDPFDIIPFVFEYDQVVGLAEGKTQHGELITSIINTLNLRCGVQLDASYARQSTDPLSIWQKFASSYKLDNAIKEDTADELSNTIKWQAHSYQHPRPKPLFSSPSIVWEQSIVEGHATHPMHKLRRFLPPIPDYQPGEYDFLNPKLRFISVPREELKITNDFGHLLEPLIQRASKIAGKPFNISEDHLAIPIHDLQVNQIKDKFTNAVIYPEEFSLPLQAQQGLRSVIIPGGFGGLHLKLAIGVRLTSVVRGISPESAYQSPRFSSQVVPVLTMDRNILTVAKELASVVHNDPDGNIARHCGAIIRECHEDTSEERGERLIVCTALVESGHADNQGHLPAVVRVFDLDTKEKKVAWLQRFVSVFLKAFLPSIIHNGVAFECHPQNCVARFDLETKELKGFLIRDFGGLRVHPETLRATTGVEFDCLKGHSIIAKTLDDVYNRTYQTIMLNHFQQLIRVLDLHYNGLGWEIVRQELKKNIPRDHALYDLWLSPESKTLPGKCFMTMRMASTYQYYIAKPFPNLIHYRGCDSELETEDTPV
ncbi:IucC family-domain-containing protein [Crepidotus variabilis]|uniref:IucC family-domain-containing protein n=1 Tax=Crepidotus variabilis TaxID=179855 RepID=A0A9P6E9D2_9AGAR|nr:IucC family-domain-containing protein [Crepidotus variabilis]